MLSDKDLKEIQKRLDDINKKSWFERWKYRKVRKEIKQYLRELELKALELDSTNLRADIRATEKAIRLKNNNIILHTAREDLEANS